MRTAGSRVSLPRTRSAAAAASSAMAITVAASSRPSASSRPRQSSAGARPAQPIATSAWPMRHGAAERVGDHDRAAELAPQRAGRGVGVERAAARAVPGAPGVGRVDAGVGAHEAVAGAADEPAAVGAQDLVRTRRGSPARGAGPCRARRPAARASQPGSTSASRTIRPSAFETTLWATRARRSGAGRRRAAAARRAARRGRRPAGPPARPGSAASADHEPLAPGGRARRGCGRRVSGRASSAERSAARSSGRVDVEPERRQLATLTVGAGGARERGVAGERAGAERRRRPRPAA